MAAIFSAMVVAWDSDSITQGPAMRKSGALGPKRMLATLKAVVGGMCERKVRGNRLCGNGRYFNFELRGRTAVTAETLSAQSKAKDLTQRSQRKGRANRENGRDPSVGMLQVRRPQDDDMKRARIRCFITQALRIIVE